jgi:hypothetical protein
MSGASRIPDGVDGKAAELLKRAYDLKSDDETHALYRDWAGTYEDTMLQGLGYLSPALVSDAAGQPRARQVSGHDRYRVWHRTGGSGASLAMASGLSTGSTTQPKCLKWLQATASTAS